MPPEQAGNWAYPQPEMTAEQIAFTLVTGLSGRLYLSGNLDRLDTDQLGLVTEATSVYREVTAHHRRAVPQWPVGLPGWDDDVVAVASAAQDGVLLFVWSRTAQQRTIRIPLAQLRGLPVEVTTVFPSALPGWAVSWQAEEGVLEIDTLDRGESARVLRVRAD